MLKGNKDQPLNPGPGMKRFFTSWIDDDCDKTTASIENETPSKQGSSEFLTLLSLKGLPKEKRNVS